VLQRVAACCSGAVGKNMKCMVASHVLHLFCSVLQCVAVCCSVAEKNVSGMSVSHILQCIIIIR